MLRTRAVRPLLLLVSMTVPLSVCTAQRAAGERVVEDSPSPPAERLEQFKIQQNGATRTLTGRILIEALDGGVLLQTDDGLLRTIEASEVVHRERLDAPFQPVVADALEERLLAELPAGFRCHTTPHYVVCYNTSREYAEWTSSLLERLYKAFTNYWSRRGFKLREPEFPLPVLVFADRQTYDAASREDLPAGSSGIVAYYSLRSNRINMFDLTGTEAMRSSGSRRGSMREINQMLSQPGAVPLVATIVHEATHQIAFNCGLQQRYADIPLWLCEGMAVYFEAPDLTSTRGWRGIGRVNYPRLETFERHRRAWRKGSLEGLLASDERFRDPRRAADAYADAWALNYYLIKHRADEYTAYLKALAAKPPLVDDPPQARLEEFRAHFGNIQQLESDFLRTMSTVR